MGEDKRTKTVKYKIDKHEELQISKNKITYMHITIFLYVI